MTHKILDDIKVVDFTTMLAGGGTTRLLADCGASIIKIESPEGDMLRAYEHDRISLYFGYYNAGKKSVVLDLKSPAGAKVALDLIRQADIVVENFRPGTMAKFGLDYAAAQAARPGIIYCSITGFGQYGPLSGKAAYAPVAHAFSGFDMLVARTDDADAPPITNGIMLADTLTPAFAFAAIQTALIRRMRSEEGTHIDVTMAESMMHMLSLQLIRAQQGARTVADYAMSAHPPYKTLDGFINIPFASVATQNAVYSIIGREDWIGDPELRTMKGLLKRRAEINAEIADWASERTSAECEDLMTKAGVPSAIYNLPHDLLEHPHVQARKILRPATADGEDFQILTPPFQFDGEPLGNGSHVSALGGDTANVLAENLGIDRLGFERLLAEGAFGSWRVPSDEEGT